MVTSSVVAAIWYGGFINLFCFCRGLYYKLWRFLKSPFELFSAAECTDMAEKLFRLSKPLFLMDIIE